MASAVILITILAAPWMPSQGAVRTAAPPGLALLMRDGRQWPGFAAGERVSLDGSVMLHMRMGDTRPFLPVVTGSSQGSNLYLDLCVPLDAFEVTPSPTWPAVDAEEWDCARYSAYVPAGGGAPEHTPREPLLVRAAREGTFTFRYRIVVADGPPVEGEFLVVVQ